MKRPSLLILQAYGFPVLGKDLVEQAERKRTYLIRVIFVAFLSVAFLISYSAIHVSGNRQQDMLGSGRQIFSILVRLQLAAIFLYVPVLMSGAVAREKERNSLSLLLLTRLRAGEIILEKLVGGLTPVFTLQFVALPLLAVAYSLGGVSTTYFWSCIYLVFLTCLQVGSFTLMLSAYCRTTVAAFVLSYLLVPGIGLANLLLDVYDSGRGMGEFALVVWTPSLLEQADDGQTFTRCFLSRVPALLSVVALLLLARRFLFLRIDAPARNHGVQLLRGIDRFMNSINRRFGNVVLFPDRTGLPLKEPVAWREVAKKSLGKPQYVVRMLLALQIPSVAIVLAASGGFFKRSAFRADYELVSVCVFVLWGVVVLILGVLGTSLIVSERTQQTLGVLLTTPISRSEIIRQKTRGLARLIKLLWIPFLTLFLFGVWARSSGVRGGAGREPGLYFLASCLTVLIYLPLLGWLATFLGLRSRNRLAAFMLFLTCVVVWSAPPLIVYVGGATVGAHLDLPGGLLLLSPITMVLVAESSIHRGVPSDLFALWAVALNAVIHGYVLYRLRRACLSGAERYLHAT